MNFGFRMYYDRIVQSLFEIQNRLQNLILHFDEHRSFFCCSFVFCCHHCNLISHIAHIFIENKSVMRAGLWVSLTSSRDRHTWAILPCQDTGYARQRKRFGRVYRYYSSKSMRASNKLDIESIGWGKIIGKGWSTEHQTFPIDLCYIVSDNIEFLGCFERFTIRGRY